MGPHRAGACASPFKGALCRCKARLKCSGEGAALPCGAVLLAGSPRLSSRVAAPKAFPRKLLWQLKEAGLVEDLRWPAFS